MNRIKDLVDHYVIDKEGSGYKKIINKEIFPCERNYIIEKYKGDPDILKEYNPISLEFLKQRTSNGLPVFSIYNINVNESFKLKVSFDYINLFSFKPIIKNKSIFHSCYLSTSHLYFYFDDVFDALVRGYFVENKVKFYEFKCNTTLTRRLNGYIPEKNAEKIKETNNNSLFSKIYLVVDCKNNIKEDFNCMAIGTSHNGISYFIDGFELER